MGYYAPVLWTYKWSKEETYVVGVAKTNVEIINVEIRNVEIINVIYVSFFTNISMTNWKNCIWINDLKEESLHQTNCSNQRNWTHPTVLGYFYDSNEANYCSIGFFTM